MKTELIKTKHVMLSGFTGEVIFEATGKASPELLRYVNLLADYAFFCGAGRKATVGIGADQTSLSQATESEINETD